MTNDLTIPSASYRRMFEVEDEHWWFHGMETIATRLFDGLVRAGELPPPADCRALDAGCGTGRNLKFLRRYSERPVGIDYALDALHPCRERGFDGRLAQASVNALPFASESFDFIASFDVLVTRGVDDAAALAEVTRVLRPGGWFFVRVAAFDWLRGQHDRTWQVTHRYNRKELRTKLRAAGLEPGRMSYLNTWLFPVAVAKRFGERFQPPAKAEAHDDLRHGVGRGIVTSALRAVLASEARLVASLPGGLPWGLSLLALARKPAAAPGPRDAGAAATADRATAYV